MQRQLTAVIVHWNQPESCVRTARQFASFAAVRRIIVVDNGSGEAATVSLRRAFTGDAKIELHEVGYNSGYGPGVNRGWREWLADPSGTEWAVVAPHDAVVDEETIDRLRDVADGSVDQHCNFGLLSADVGDGAAPFVDHVFGPITRPATSTNSVELVDYPHGTLFAVSRTLLGNVGMFDERFFSYCEEADLGLRAKAAGFDVGLVRGARVLNPHVNTPTPVIDYLQERNTILLIAKHFGPAKAALRFTLTLAHYGIGLLRPSRRGLYFDATARGQAIRDVLRRSWGAPPDSLLPAPASASSETGLASVR